MKWYTVVTLGIVLIVYTVIGGVIFSHLESRYEDDLRDQVLSDLKTFIDESPCVNMTALGHAYALLQDMKEAGLEIQSDGSMVRKTLWDIRSSLFVSLQLLATIGFPEAAPRSAGGRGFTIPYAILGIPLFLVAAIGMGQVFNGVAEAFRKCLTRACRREPDCGAKVFRTIIISVTGIIFFIIIPSLIFKQIEPWSYGDAFYFSFITLATIGFGDLVPSYNDVRWMSDNYRNWYRLAIAFWILLLSAWFAGVLVSIQTSVTAAAFSTKNRLHIKSLEEDVLDDYVSTNMNLAMPKDMKVKHPPKHSTYNHYIHQQQWQQEQQQVAVAASPYNIYNSQQNGQQPQATYGTGNSVAYGEITRLSV